MIYSKYTVILYNKKHKNITICLRLFTEQVVIISTMSRDHSTSVQHESCDFIYKAGDRSVHAA